MTLAGRKRHLAKLVVVFAGAFMASAAPAHADAASDMAQELIASGVPGAQVEIGPPANAAEAELDPDAPTMPVARVTINAPAPAPLAGVFQPSRAGSFEYTTLPSNLVVWELAVLEGAKHRIVDGTALAGVAIKLNVAGQPPVSDPYVMLGLADLAASASPAETLSMESIRNAVQGSLPPWAATAAVNVTEDAASQRVVTVALAIPTVFVRVNDVRAISNVLAQQQAVLTARGANIGRCIVRVTDSQTGDPLYVSGDDVLLGTRSYWDSPLVAGFLGPGLLSGELLASRSGADTTPLNNALPTP
jgi:hypothetical protein